MNKVYNVTGSMMALFLTQANDRTIGAALGRIYDRQTEAEKAIGQTEQTNGVGFSSFDAKTGSYIVEWTRKNDKAPSGRYLLKAKKMVHKYREQLADIYGCRPELFERDFGIHLAVAMRSTLRDLAAKRLDEEARANREPEKVVTVTARVIDQDGCVKEYLFKGPPGSEAADFARAFDQFTNKATKAFVAGKVLPANLPSSIGTKEEISFAAVG